MYEVGQEIEKNTAKVIRLHQRKYIFHQRFNLKRRKNSDTHRSFLYQKSVPVTFCILIFHRNHSKKPKQTAFVSKNEAR